MDARTYIKVSVGSLGLRIPRYVSAEPLSGSLTYSCEIRLHSFAVQTAPVPFLTDDKTSVEVNPGIRSNSSANGSNRSTNRIAASFYLDELDLRRLLKIPCFKSSSPCLEILVLTGMQGALCGLNARRQIGKVKISVSQDWAEGRPLEIYHGWTRIGRKNDRSGRPTFEFHAIVKVEPDPRFVFQFDGEPALGSQIIQSKGSFRQTVFSCKFSRDRSSQNGYDDGFNGWTMPSSSERNEGKWERKGWLVMIHDLSGSPVAAASMVTPFVPSSGSKYVGRSNPGAWLILRPELDGILRLEPGGVSSWSPWGRLEAWREQGLNGGLGCRLHLLPTDGGGMNGVHNGILVTETVICAHKG